MGHGLHEVAAALGGVPRAAVAEAAAEIAGIAEAEARRATGDGRMSGVGRRGAVLRTVARATGGDGQAAVTISGVPAGAWALLEGGAAPHVISPGRRAGVLVGASLLHPVRGPVRHPGARAKRTWERVTERAERAVPELVDDQVGEAIR